MTVTKQTLVGEVIDCDVNAAKFFFEIGMHCVGCPASAMDSLEEACEVHGADVNELVQKINDYLAQKS